MRRMSILAAALLFLLSACGGAATVESTNGNDIQPPASKGTTGLDEQPTTTEPAMIVEAPELGGTSWNVTEYVLPGGSITNVWKTEVTISFSTDGAVSGSAGCNGYQGTWRVSGDYDQFESGVRDPNDGQELLLESLSWTEVACEDAAIMEQEAEILDLLQNGGRWVLIRGNFNLRDAQGAFLFEAEPA